MGISQVCLIVVRFDMRKLNGWVRLGIVLSAAWMALTTFTYFNEIVNHPSFAARHTPMLDSYFNWVDDNEATAKAHEEAKVHGKDFSDQGVFLKPTFNLAGYFQFALLPVVIGWFGTYLIVWIFRWVNEGFRT